MSLKIIDEIKILLNSASRVISCLVSKLTSSGHVPHPKVHGMKISLNTQHSITHINTQGNFKMTYSLKNSELTTIHAVAVDALGVAVADATFVWTTSDATIVALTPANDGKSAVATTTGATGSAVVTVVSGNATGTFNIDVVTGEAVSIVLTADAPVSRIVVDAPAAA